MDKTKRATCVFYENIGLDRTPKSSGRAVMYENIGLEKTLPTALVRQPRGWGFIPNTSQTVMVLSKGSRATMNIYTNILES